MKLKMKVLALLTLLVLCVASLGMAEEAELMWSYDDVTTICDYQDAVGQRASLSISVDGTGAAACAIHWSSSAAETRVWLFDLETPADANERTYRYTNCLCRDEIAAGEDEVQFVTVYENGTGSLTFTEAGVTWQDDQADAGAQCRFERVGEARTEAYYEGLENENNNLLLFAPVSELCVRKEATISVILSESESYIWELSFMSKGADYTEDAGFTPYAYNDAVCIHAVRNEDGSWAQETVYENGTGTLLDCWESENRNGYLWTPDHDDVVSSMLFVIAQVQGPARDLAPDDEDPETEYDDECYYDDEQVDCEQLARDWQELMDALKELAGMSALRIDSVGTMDDTDDTVYCIDAHYCMMCDFGQPTFSVVCDEETDFVRLVLAADMELLYDDQNGKLAWLTGPEALAGWFEAKAASGSVQYYLYELNDFDEVELLRYLDIE